MLYVGLTEDHKGSATAFAHVVGAQVISQLAGSNSSRKHEAKNITGQWYKNSVWFFYFFFSPFFLGGGSYF